MTSPVGFWTSTKEGDPENMNAGLVQYVAFASLPTKTGLQGMVAIVTDGVAGNGGPPAVYVRADATAAWTLQGTLKALEGVSASDATKALSASTWTSCDLDSEQWDSDAFHDTVTNNSRFTIPTGMGGKYLIGGYIDMEATGSSTTVNGARLLLNGTTLIAKQMSVGSVTAENEMCVVIAYDLAAAAYVELQAFANLTSGYTSAKMWMHRIG